MGNAGIRVVAVVMEALRVDRGWMMQNTNKVPGSRRQREQLVHAGAMVVARSATEQGGRVDGDGGDRTL